MESTIKKIRNNLKIRKLLEISQKMCNDFPPDIKLWMKQWIKALHFSLRKSNHENDKFVYRQIIFFWWQISAAHTYKKTKKSVSIEWKWIAEKQYLGSSVRTQTCDIPRSPSHLSHRHSLWYCHIPCRGVDSCSCRKERNHCNILHLRRKEQNVL